ncbi:urotensin-2 receptor [Nerophis ophidion]|uniref:urotensin-2 receptor n=1 Tax=Nerophis ophidion TaxID=159077 RepID=UPI002ADF59A9|nr:urotensin-2 receptor [Nerophis ophidion]
MFNGYIKCILCGVCLYEYLMCSCKEDQSSKVTPGCPKRHLGVDFVLCWLLLWHPAEERRRRERKGAGPERGDCWILDGGVSRRSCWPREVCGGSGLVGLTSRIPFLLWSAADFPILSPAMNGSNASGDGGSSGSGGLWVTSLLGAALLVMWLLGVAGNAYTLVVTRSAALRRTGSVYVYVANLALADLLYLSTIPFVVCTYFAHDWLFGEAGCRVLLSLDLLTMHASVFILVAMSLERYRAVARPFGARDSTPRRRKLAAAAIWATAFALTLPMMVMIRLREGKPSPAGVVKRMCFPTWTLEAFKAYVTALFLTSVLIPGLVIVGLYAGLARRYWAAQARLAGRAGSARRRGLKQRVVVMIFSIVVAYWACFLPFWAWQLAQLFSAESLKALSSSTHNYVNFLVTCLTYGNSCVNPFLYTLLTRNYKDYLAQKGQSTVSSRTESLAPVALPQRTRSPSGSLD